MQSWFRYHNYCGTPVLQCTVTVSFWAKLCTCFNLEIESCFLYQWLHYNASPLHCHHLPHANTNISTLTFCLSFKHEHGYLSGCLYTVGGYDGNCASTWSNTTMSRWIMESRGIYIPSLQSWVLEQKRCRKKSSLSSKKKLFDLQDYHPTTYCLPLQWEYDTSMSL